MFVIAFPSFALESTAAVFKVCLCKGKGEGKLFLLNAMKAYRKSGSIAPLIPNLGSTCK